MKISYNREDDIAMIELSHRRIDHAQQAANVITHFSKDNELVLLEILDATTFLTDFMRTSLRAKSEKPRIVK